MPRLTRVSGAPPSTTTGPTLSASRGAGASSWLSKVSSWFSDREGLWSFALETEKKEKARLKKERLVRNLTTARGTINDWPTTKTDGSKTFDYTDLDNLASCRKDIKKAIKDREITGEKRTLLRETTAALKDEEKSRWQFKTTRQSERDAVDKHATVMAEKKAAKNVNDWMGGVLGAAVLGTWAMSKVSKATSAVGSTLGFGGVDTAASNLESTFRQAATDSAFTGAGASATQAEPTLGTAFGTAASAIGTILSGIGTAASTAGSYLWPAAKTTASVAGSAMGSAATFASRNPWMASGLVLGTYGTYVGSRYVYPTVTNTARR